MFAIISAFSSSPDSAMLDTTRSQIFKKILNTLQIFMLNTKYFIIASNESLTSESDEASQKTDLLQKYLT